MAYGTAPLPKDRKGTCVKAVDEWYDEIAEYDFNNPGFNSKTGKCNGPIPINQHFELNKSREKFHHSLKARASQN